MAGRSQEQTLRQVAFDLRDPDRSGIARVARSIAREFVAAAPGRFDVTLCGPAATLERLGVSGWGPSNVVDWQAERFSPAAEWSWRRVKRSAAADTWYFPHWDAPWNSFPRRSIVTVHDLTALRVPGATTPLRRELSRLWIRHSASHAARIIVGTAFSRDEVAEEWPDLRTKIRVIPHGVDERFLGEPAELPAALESAVAAGPFMLSVGNRKPHKNLVMGPEVLARIPELRWIVVGEQFRGWDEVPRRAAELGVSDRVIVLDPQPDSVLHSLYAAAGCLFFPSRHEGFGLPVLESLAAGSPVVAGSAGATLEVLGGHGIACPPGDGDAFAEAVRKMVFGPRPDPAAGRAHAATFTWARAAERLAAVLEEI